MENKQYDHISFLGRPRSDKWPNIYEAEFKDAIHPNLKDWIRHIQRTSAENGAGWNAQSPVLRGVLQDMVCHLQDLLAHVPAKGMVSGLSETQLRICSSLISNMHRMINFLISFAVLTDGSLQDLFDYEQVLTNSPSPVQAGNSKADPRLLKGLLVDLHAALEVLELRGDPLAAHKPLPVEQKRFVHTRALVGSSADKRHVIIQLISLHYLLAVLRNRLFDSQEHVARRVVLTAEQIQMYKDFTIVRPVDSTLNSSQVIVYQDSEEADKVLERLAQASKDANGYHQQEQLLQALNLPADKYGAQAPTDTKAYAPLPPLPTEVLKLSLEKAQDNLDNLN